MMSHMALVTMAHAVFNLNHFSQKESIMTQSQQSFAYAQHQNAMRARGLHPLSYHRFLIILNQLGY